MEAFFVMLLKIGINLNGNYILNQIVGNKLMKLMLNISANHSGDSGISGGKIGAKMDKIKLHKSEGYAKFNKKNQGIFISHKRGTYKDIPYHKVRLTQIFVRKEGGNITMQRPYRFIAFDVDMLKSVAELLNEIHKEIHSVGMYDEVKEVSVAEPKKESEEVDEILAQLENMGRK